MQINCLNFSHKLLYMVKTNGTFTVRIFILFVLIILMFAEAKHRSLSLDFVFYYDLLCLFPQYCHLVNRTAMSWNDCAAPKCSVDQHCRNKSFDLNIRCLFFTHTLCDTHTLHIAIETECHLNDHLSMKQCQPSDLKV